MKTFRILLAASAAIVAVAPIVAPSAFAQETTSTIRGVVTSQGVPVAGAAVEIVHVPTGTLSTAVTGADGGFVASSLRVGGPFRVSVKADGYVDFTATEVYTVVGTPYALPVELAASGDVIVVTASSITGAGAVSSGPATVLTRDEIELVASYNRDIRDLSRRDPFATIDLTNNRAVSFAGQNPRFNRFSVDGVAVSDSFGLNPDGLPSRRGPVPLDAIGQFQVKVAPFDIREGNFQGGAINVVLRSGTNDFQGTGFYSYSDNKLTGNRVDGAKVALPAFKSRNFGAELSGPIIKDKLFFMVAAERVRAANPILFGPADQNAAAVVPGLTSSLISQIQQTAKSKYNYETGAILTSDGDKDDRIVAKLDANLSETQRLALTFTYTDDALLVSQNTDTAPATPSIGLESNGYIQGNRLYTGIAQWNGEWSDSFSTEVRGFYKNYKRIQDPILGRGFAQFRVCTAPTSDSDRTNCPSGVPVIAFGPDVSRQSNALKATTWGVSILPRLQLGDHDVKLLFEYQRNSTFNLFLQRSTGDFYFDSLASFSAGNADRLRYQNATSLNPNDAAASFAYSTYTFGIQDDWRLTDSLNVSAGVRYDTFGSNSHAVLNPNFVARYGFPNNDFLSGVRVIQPRVGFDWKPLPRLSLRGGVGIFAGGAPDVYFSNSFSNTGFVTSSVDIRRNSNGTFTGADATTGAAALNNVSGASIPAPVNTLLANSTSVAAASTNAVARDFELPQQLRATLSADYKADLGVLGDGWRFGFDFLYNKVREQVAFTDIRSVASNLKTPDGRTRYVGRISNADTNSDILLTNVNRGRGYIAVARFDKDLPLGLNIGGSYTYQDIKDQAPAVSTTAFSNYERAASLDANIAAYGTSNDEIRHQFKYYVNFDKAFFGDYRTRIGLFGETRTGRPYSYTFLDPVTSRSPVFGTVGSGSRYLMYVPTGLNDPLVSYDSAATATALDAFINADKKLSAFRGKIAPRNGFRSPWYTKIDLHVEQELPTFVGKSRFTLFGDIENLTNLINSSWGLIRQYAFPYNNALVRVACLAAPAANGTGTPITTPTQACAQYRYSSFAKPQTTLYSTQSLYTIRVGVRVSF